MGGGIKEFYSVLWFGDEEVAFDVAINDIFDGGRAKVTGRRLPISFTQLGAMARLLSSDQGRLYTHQWISQLWFGGNLSSNQSSRRQLTAIFSSWFTSQKLPYSSSPGAFHEG